MTIREDLQNRLAIYQQQGRSFMAVLIINAMDNMSKEELDREIELDGEEV